MFGRNTNEIAADLVVAAGAGTEEFGRAYEQVQALPLEDRQAVFSRLADTTPNPTGDR